MLYFRIRDHFIRLALFIGAAIFLILIAGPVLRDTVNIFMAVLSVVADMTMWAVSH